MENVLTKIEKLREAMIMAEQIQLDGGQVVNQLLFNEADRAALKTEYVRLLKEYVTNSDDTDLIKIERLRDALTMSEQVQGTTQIMNELLITGADRDILKAEYKRIVLSFTTTD